jgi:hypothetical protein
MRFDLWMVLPLVACDRAVTFKLPDEPDQELAVALLYDGETLIEIGEVQRTRTLYSGRYAIDSASRGLGARIVFADATELIDASRRACSALGSAVERAACDGLVDRCAADPAQCLSIARAAEGCGPRVAFGDTLPLAGFEAEAGREFSPISGEVLAGAVACGPIASPPCPLRLPGFTLTEAGKLTCIAPAEQLGCELNVDLSRCGFEDLRGTLSEDGSLMVSSGSCTVEALGGAETIGGAEGNVFVCGGRRLVASAMGRLFGELGCRRNGSGVYDSEPMFPGVISGVVELERAGWPRRHLMTGFGLDDCAVVGCQLRGSSCDLCYDSCDQDFALMDCARNDWALCTELDAREECLSRCLDWCNRAEASCGDAYGLVLTTHAPGAPELERVRIDLDLGGDRAADGTQALATLDPDLIAVASRDRLILVQAMPSTDELREQSELPASFEIAGVLARPPDELFAFGTSGGVLRARATSILEAQPFEAIAGAGDFSAGAITDRWLVLVDSTRAYRVPLDGGARPPPVELPGRPTAIASLGESVLIATDASQLALLDLETGGATMLPLPEGIRIASLAADTDNDRFFAGVEAVEASARGLLGIIERDGFTPALVETEESEVSLLFLDRVDSVLHAIARHRNVISPIRLIK